MRGGGGCGLGKMGGMWGLWFMGGGAFMHLVGGGGFSLRLFGAELRSFERWW